MNNLDLLKAIGDIDDKYLCENSKESKEEKKYNSIQSRVKGGIYMKKKLLNCVAVLLLILVIGTIGQGVYAKIAWEIAYEEYQKRNIVVRQIALDEESKEGYTENLEMDYIYQDEIGIKITSLMLTNDYCEIGLDIKLDEETQKEVNKGSFSYGYVIYDESNNVYAYLERIPKYKANDIYWKKLSEELGIKSKHIKTLSDTVNFDTSRINITSVDGLPQSKKLYIRIFELGYVISEYDSQNNKITRYEDIPLSESEWQFEIYVPEKFYNRKAVELALSEETEGITINKAELTETALVMKVNIKGLRKFMMSGADMERETFGKLRDVTFYISDGDGNIYKPTNMGTTNNKDEISARFGIGEDALDKKIFLNVSLNDIQAKIELVQK